jgi:hypothetical protein
VIWRCPNCGEHLVFTVGLEAVAQLAIDADAAQRRLDWREVEDAALLREARPDE